MRLRPKLEKRGRLDEKLDKIVITIRGRMKGGEWAGHPSKNLTVYDSSVKEVYDIIYNAVAVACAKEEAEKGE